MLNLARQRILITGGHGFLGRHLIRRIEQLRPQELRWPNRKECDLLDPANCRRAVENIDLVIHAAAKVGGIEANRAAPGEFFYENALMGIQLLEAARQAGVKKFVQIGTVCEYPQEIEQLPYREEDLWFGYPEATNGPYGMSKKTLLVHGQAYRQQYALNVIHLLLTNLYGPGDHFGQKDAHVIASLIDRFAKAKQQGVPEVVCWGTGSPTREFLYVEDAAEGIIKAAEHYDGAEPINLGSGQEISIRYLADLIAEQFGYTGRITWDTSKPDGQPRRSFDSSKAKKQFAFTAKTRFPDGLTNTIAWYKELVAPKKKALPQY
ncbi:MAG: GDP-fucose synthetase [Candidatus Andersenbacteria bacterium CG10_big_fil_rev_8_21_14_0_10_54_11]|uniref:GDP-L-fucose synthase n=1 Tax=Candidatus Andersenbacteria bacterium CG10_big_fil_rev_8_21_14_0_10_54_11 TaxID=1974485 RepID=A0A2M6WZA5_9BACT|nr:MAG: GDP-fucose synthetase [Candidatus Andersenbacteria bacterium CG10_big_fil_rev_8_21_14_0_10_54_11]